MKTANADNFIQSAKDCLLRIAPRTKLIWLTPNSNPPQQTLITSDIAKGSIAADIKGLGRIRYDLAKDELELGFDVDIMTDPDKSRWQVNLVSLATALIAATQHKITFHGNVLTDGRSTFGLIGDAGSGKSTLAAFAVQNGDNLVTDDVIVLAENDQVLPVRKFLNLTKNSLQNLLGKDDLPVDFGNLHKCFLEVSNLLNAEPKSVAVQKVPRLSHLYFLEVGDRIQIETIENPALALKKMLNHSIFVAALIEKFPENLDRAIKYLSRTTVRRLAYPRTFAALPETLKALKTDLGERPQDNDQE